MQKIVSILRSNTLLKTGSLIAGALFWYAWSGMHITTIAVQVPLYFYGLKEEQVIDAPASVHILLEGKRSYLYDIDPNSIAFHINGEQLKYGTQHIEITQKEIFLPTTLKLIHYNPTTIEVTLSHGTYNSAPSFPRSSIKDFS